MKRNSIVLLVVAAIFIASWIVVGRGGGAGEQLDLAGPSVAEEEQPLVPGELVAAAGVVETPQQAPSERTPGEAPAQELVEEAAPVPASSAVEDPADENPGSIKVSVLDASGQPLAGVKLNALSVGERSFVSLASAVTNKQGQATLVGLPLGLLRVAAESTDFAPGGGEVFSLTEVRPEGNAEIVLSMGGAAEGQLTDLHGGLAAGIRITIHLKEWPGSVDGSHPSVMQMADTDKEGRFRFERLMPGTYNLHTRAEGQRLEDVPKQRVELEVVDGQTTRVEFKDASGSFVKLSGVVLRNGEPLAKARLGISWADRSRGYLGKNTRADDNGRFKITLDEGGNYRFQISGDRASGSVFREISIPSSPTHEIEIAFSTGRISGHLFGPDGEPVVGVKVSAFGHSDELGGGTTYSSSVSNEEGAFDFPHLLGGTYKLTAAIKPLHSPEPLNAPALPHLGSVEIVDLSLEAGQTIGDVKLILSAAAAIEGQVSDAEGSPAPSATIECRSAGYRGGPGPSSWRADKSGVYLAGGLEAGDYQMRALRQHEVSAWMPVSARLNSTARLDLVLKPGTMVQFEARADGGPLARAYARIEDEKGVIIVGTILEDGTAQLGPLYPGSYTAVISTSTQPERKAQLEFSVAGEASTTVSLELP